jgi:hypothetical protein
MAVMTSLNFERGQLAPGGDEHHYRSLTWAELASRNQFWASITSPDDMMQRFESRAAHHGYEIEMVSTFLHLCKHIFDICLTIS